MKIAVFGATGGTGRAFVEQALAQSHLIRALVRTPAKLDMTHTDLTVIEGDVQDAAAVEETIAGCEAVFCSLGNTADNPDNIVTIGTANILAGMKKLGVERLVVISSLGVGDSKDQVPFAFKVLAKTVLRKAMQDKESQEKLVQQSGLRWTIIRPGGLQDQPMRADVTIGTGSSVSAGSVPRANVAAFALQEMTDPQYVEQTPAIT